VKALGAVIRPLVLADFDVMEIGVGRRIAVIRLDPVGELNAEGCTFGVDMILGLDEP